MNLGLTESLPSLVSRRFTAAKESGSLLFSATHLAILSSKRGIDYQLRYCPALSKKPEKQSPQNKPPGPKPDPFENPSGDLLITDVSLCKEAEKSHNLILNKFPVIPNHFILATKQFEKQTDLLEKEDLGIAYACLEAWEYPSPADGVDVKEEEKRKERRRRRRLFMFFNSGDESGASQPHRHVQFLPIEDMRDQEEDSESEKRSASWIPLIDLLLTSADVQTSSSSGIRHLPNLPVQHFAMQIPRSESSPSPSVDKLHEIYLSLYHAALLASTTSPSVTTEEQTRTSGAAAISYNLAMTRDIMMICPRRKETATLSGLGADSAADVSLNGTILAGTLMVKTEEQWDCLRGDGEVVNDLLAEVGIPI